MTDHTTIQAKLERDIAQWGEGFAASGDEVMVLIRRIDTLELENTRLELACHQIQDGHAASVAECLKLYGRIDTLESQLAAVRELCDNGLNRAKEHFRVSYKSAEVDQENMIARVGYERAIKDIRAAIDGGEKP